MYNLTYLPSCINIPLQSMNLISSQQQYYFYNLQKKDILPFNLKQTSWQGSTASQSWWWRIIVFISIYILPLRSIIDG